MNVFITGTSRGIGLELTKQFLEKRFNVFATARNPEKSKPLQNLRETFSEQLKIFSLDVLSDSEIQKVSESMRGKSIDLLINNAGVYADESYKFEDVPIQILENSFQTNTLGPFRVTRAFLEHLKKSSEPKVCHITSLMGSIADNESGGYYGYRMSKAALNMFNKSFSIDYPEVVSIVMHPGWVKTDMGGDQAPTSVQDSASGIIQILLNLKKSDSGKFFDFQGEQLPY